MACCRRYYHKYKLELIIYACQMSANVENATNYLLSARDSAMVTTIALLRSSTVLRMTGGILRVASFSFLQGFVGNGHSPTVVKQ